MAQVIYMPQYRNPWEQMLPQFVSNMILQHSAQKFRERMLETERGQKLEEEGYTTTPTTTPETTTLAPGSEQTVGEPGFNANIPSGVQRPDVTVGETGYYAPKPKISDASGMPGFKIIQVGNKFELKQVSKAPTPFSIKTPEGEKFGVFNSDGTVSWVPHEPRPTTAIAKFLEENPNATQEQVAEYQRSLSPEKQPRPVVTWKTPTGETLNLREGDMPPEGSVKQGVESPNFATNDNFSSWTPSQKEFAFENFKLTGQPPKFYYRDKESLNAFNKEMADYFASKGEKPADLKAAQTSLAGLKTSLQNQEKVRGMMGGFVRNMDKQIDRVKEIHQDIVSRLGVRAVDLPLREIRTRAIGSGDEQIINSYLIEISNEIGKLSTGSAASIRELSVDAQERWAKIHDPNLSFKEIMKVLETTRDQGQMRIDSQNEELLSTKEKISRVSDREPVKKGKLTDPGIASRYLKKAGGDKNKARELARQDGWEF